ncbi:hypothetical protein PV327_006143 [Microctonus hyperodae]|uniref:Dehydrogenase/reductase SDR family member 7 n=1 Tax=Microctonus hyperodae TaxID=165561 RepID=A0AA39G2V4_MICHY|nr:hypothetical protein PV327_006143 [Microctonus hyperodae]
MNWWEIVGITTIFYYITYFVIPWFIDCDINLYMKEKFGRPLNSLQGKVVWIIGASSGIGEHLAYELAKINCKLILSARRDKELQQVRNNCLKINLQLNENDVKVLVMDICDNASHKKALNYVISQFDKLDILVNNAGRSQRANWEKIDLNVDKEMFQLNVFSIIALSRLVYQYFTDKNSGKGHIVVTSSLAGILGIPYSGSYTGSKHALHGYFESLRMEKMNKHIPITMVCPGAINTPFLAESFTEEFGKKFGQKTEYAKNKLTAARCGYLMTVAIANQVNECWIAHSLALQLTYIAKYYPNLASLMFYYLGQGFLQRLRDNKITVSNVKQ